MKQKTEGRPAYDPRSLYKLYIYGNREGIRSSMKLAAALIAVCAAGMLGTMAVRRKKRI